jgi:hypothetical protein
MPQARTAAESNVYAAQDTFPVPGGSIELPLQAKGRAHDTLAAKLKPYLGDLAGAVAELPIDPTTVRQALADGDFEYIDTPSGRKFECLRFRGWSSGLSGDGANGRSRLELLRAANVDPWPMPTSEGTALAYKAASVDRMAKAVEASAKSILTTDMVVRVRSNARGIWNPPIVVAAKLTLDNGTEFGFVHTVEGSTRASASHHVVGTDQGAPLQHAGAVRELIRAERARVASGLVSKPDSRAARDAAKLLAIPLRVVIRVLNSDGTACMDPFAEVVSEFVESVHEEPRPWDELEQGNAMGERLLIQLHAAGLIDEDAFADLLDRDDFHQPTSTPSRRTAALLRAGTKSSADRILRQVILSDPNARNLTGRRKATAFAPLVLRAHRRMLGLRESSVAALSRPFMPGVLHDDSWKVDDTRTVDELIAAGEAAFAAGPSVVGDDVRELIATAVGPMAALGLVLSDQGQAVDNHSELRGHVSEVMEGLGKSLGGIRLMGDAVRRADGAAAVMPVERSIDGTEVTVTDSDDHEIPVRYDPADRQTNIKIRALALNGGVIPSGGPGPGPKPPLPPDQQFAELEDRLAQTSGTLVKLTTQLADVRGTDDLPLLATRKLDPVKIGPVQQRLMDTLQFVLQNIGAGPAEADDLPLVDDDDDLIDLRSDDSILDDDVINETKAP